MQQPQLHHLPTPQSVELSSVHTSQSLAVTSGAMVVTPMTVNNSLAVSEQSLSNDVMMQSLSSDVMMQSLSSDVMMQSLLYSMSSSPSMVSDNNTTSVPSSSSSSSSSDGGSATTVVSSEDATAHTSTVTSLYGSVQSGGMVTTTSQSNSLDQLNPFG